MPGPVRFCIRWWNRPGPRLGAQSLPQCVVRALPPCQIGRRASRPAADVFKTRHISRVGAILSLAGGLGTGSLGFILLRHGSASAVRERRVANAMLPTECGCGQATGVKLLEEFCPLSVTTTGALDYFHFWCPLGECHTRVARGRPRWETSQVERICVRFIGKQSVQLKR